TGRVNAVNPRNGVEDNFPTLRLLVVDAGSQGDRAEGDLGAAVGPGDAGIGDVVACIRHLNDDIEPDGSPRQPRPDLIEKEIGRSLCGFFVVQVLGTCLGSDAESAMAADAVGVEI